MQKVAEPLFAAVPLVFEPGAINFTFLASLLLSFVPSVGLYSTGFWRFFGFFSKMNMERSNLHLTGQCRENQALCVRRVRIELI